MSMAQWIRGVQTLIEDDIPANFPYPDNDVDIDWHHPRILLNSANGVVTLWAKIPQDLVNVKVDMLDPGLHGFLMRLAQRGPGGSAASYDDVQWRLYWTN